MGTTPRGTSSAWMFEDRDPGTMTGAGQRLAMAQLRMFVTTLYIPVIRPLSRWLGSRASRRTGRAV